MFEEGITFKNTRGDRLSGVLHHPSFPAPKSAVILCHGMDSNKGSEKLVFLAREIAAAGVLALRFDFAYVGESSGCFEEITCSGEMDDLKAAYELVQNHRGEKIALMGSSMGGTVALLFAAGKADIAALVTLAAPLHPENFPRRMLTAAQIRDWRECGFTRYNGRRLNVSLLDDLEQLDLPRAARAVTCPTLVLHGDADTVVPVEEAYELHGCLAAPKRLSILPGGDHRLSNPALMERALKESLDWLLAHLL
jgi:alpha-beta hydrolase superfamily lysophospholipase